MRRGGGDARRGVSGSRFVAREGACLFPPTRFTVGRHAHDATEPAGAAAVLLVGLIGVGAAAVIRIQTGQGDYVIEPDDPDFSLQVHHDEVTLRDLKANRTYNLKVVGGDKNTGEMELQLAEEGGALSFKGKTLTIKRGERVALKARVEPGRQAAADPPPGEDEESWRRWVAVLPPDLQVQAVAARLKVRNPRFNEQLTHWERDGHVEWLRVPTEDVTDLSPLLALGALGQLDCRGAFKEPNMIGPSRFADLSPLKNLKNLVSIECSDTLVADLSPLHGAPLTKAWFPGTRVSDLSPLRGMALTELSCRDTRVSDLSPLRGMPLTTLYCQSIAATDLSPLKGMPLKILRCDFKTGRDAEILRSITTLEQINDQSAKEFWKEVDES